MILLPFKHVATKSVSGNYVERVFDHSICGSCVEFHVEHDTSIAIFLHQSSRVEARQNRKRKNYVERDVLSGARIHDEHLVNVNIKIVAIAFVLMTISNRCITFVECMWIDSVKVIGFFDESVVSFLIESDESDFLVFYVVPCVNSFHFTPKLVPRMVNSYV